MVCRKNVQGVSLLEATISLLILGVVVFVTLPVATRFLDVRREEGTREQLLNLKRAIVGQPRRVLPAREVLTQFGYVGDMGRVPASLQDLVEQGTQPPFQVDSVSQVGHGWRGPYLRADSVEDVLNDAWGNPLLYTVAPGTDPVTGATVEARIRSTGLDGIEGTADDLTVNLYRTEVFSEVTGFVKDPTQAPLFRVNVTLKYPLAGSLAATTNQTDTQGRYTFQNIPLGSRSISLEPKIIYQSGSALTTGAAKDTVEFVVTNVSRDPVTFNALVPVYQSSPQAFFRRVFLDGVKVFDSTSPRGGSGTVVSFTSHTLAGTGVIQESFQVFVHRLRMHLPDFPIGTLGQGGEMKIELQDFDDTSSGNGTAVDMTGVVFEVTFRNAGQDIATVLLSTRRGV